MSGYPGGKAGDGVYQKIINQMPPHDLYSEPFAGAAAILRAKRPASWSVVRDLDPRAIEKIKALRVPGCLAEVGDGIELLEARHFWRSNHLVYCDPPYPMSSRKGSGRLYRFQMTDDDHVRLLRALKKLPCMVLVSSYDSELYRRELATWRLVTFSASTRQGVATEHLWANFPEPTSLHDYSYLGEDYRERERIKRKLNRWRRRLAAMDPLERRLLAAALAENNGGVVIDNPHNGNPVKTGFPLLDDNLDLDV